MNFIVFNIFLTLLFPCCSAQALVESHFERDGINLAVFQPLSSPFTAFTGDYVRSLFGWWTTNVNNDGGILLGNGTRIRVGWDLYNLI